MVLDSPQTKSENSGAATARLERRSGFVSDSSGPRRRGREEGNGGRVGAGEGMAQDGSWKIHEQAPSLTLYKCRQGRECRNVATFLAARIVDKRTGGGGLKTSHLSLAESPNPRSSPSCNPYYPRSEQASTARDIYSRQLCSRGHIVLALVSVSMSRAILDAVAVVRGNMVVVRDDVHDINKARARCPRSWRS